jgi:hypothetical protein
MNSTWKYLYNMISTWKNLIWFLNARIWYDFMRKYQMNSFFHWNAFLIALWKTSHQMHMISLKDFIWSHWKFIWSTLRDAMEPFDGETMDTRWETPDFPWYCRQGSSRWDYANETDMSWNLDSHWNLEIALLTYASKSCIALHRRCHCRTTTTK